MMKPKRFIVIRTVIIEFKEQFIVLLNGKMKIEFSSARLNFEHFATHIVPYYHNFIS